RFSQFPARLGRSEAGKSAPEPGHRHRQRPDSYVGNDQRYQSHGQLARDLAMALLQAKSSSGRSGFTLVELLVVIGILALLAGMGVAFLPAVNQKRTAAYGAEIVVNTLAAARQRAKRDGLSTGVRIYFKDASAGAGTLRTRLRPVQTPPDFNFGV